MKHLIVILSLALASIAGASTGVPCKTWLGELRPGGVEDAVVVTERIFGRYVNYVRLKTKQVKYGRASAGQIFSDPDALYFAFNRRGHAYLLAGTVRFDGDYFSLAGFNDNTDLLDSGIVFKFPMPAGSADGYQEAFADPYDFNSFNCVRAASIACRAVSGYRTTRLGSTVFSTSTLKALMRGEVVNAAGERVQPSIFLLNAESMQPIIADAIEEERIRIYPAGLLAALMGSSLAMGTVDLFHRLFDISQH